MPQFDERVDNYIAQSADFAQPILHFLRAATHKACPDVEETWKWSFPNFYYQGKPMCSMASFKAHCSFSFWQAALMPDPAGILILTEREAMGQLGKIKLLADLPSEPTLIQYIKAAMELIDTGVKKPARPKTTKADKDALIAPADLISSLSAVPNALANYNSFSYSCQKEYIEWITEAKTEATRNKRIAQATEWIAEHKERNWKYKK